MWTQPRSRWPQNWSIATLLRNRPVGSGGSDTAPAQRTAHSFASPDCFHALGGWAYAYLYPLADLEVRGIDDADQIYMLASVFKRARRSARGAAGAGAAAVQATSDQADGSGFAKRKFDAAVAKCMRIMKRAVADDSPDNNGTRHLQIAVMIASAPADAAASEQRFWAVKASCSSCLRFNAPAGAADGGGTTHCSCTRTWTHAPLVNTCQQRMVGDIVAAQQGSAAPEMGQVQQRKLPPVRLSLGAAGKPFISWLQQVKEGACMESTYSIAQALVYCESPIAFLRDLLDTTLTWYYLCNDDAEVPPRWWLTEPLMQHGLNNCPPREELGGRNGLLKRAWTTTTIDPVHILEQVFRCYAFHCTQAVAHQICGGPDNQYRLRRKQGARQTFQTVTAWQVFSKSWQSTYTAPRNGEVRDTTPSWLQRKELYRTLWDDEAGVPPCCGTHAWWRPRACVCRFSVLEAPEPCHTLPPFAP